MTDRRVTPFLHEITASEFCLFDKQIKKLFSIRFSPIITTLLPESIPRTKTFWIFEDKKKIKNCVSTVAILCVTMSFNIQQPTLSKRPAGFSAVSWQLSHMAKLYKYFVNGSKWAQIQEKWFSLLAAQLNGPSLLCGHFGKRCATTLHSMAKGQKISKSDI